MDSWQSAFAPWTANILFIIFENADGIYYLYGEGGGASAEKEGTAENGPVIITNIIYMLLLINIMLADFHHLLLF